MEFKWNNNINDENESGEIENEGIFTENEIDFERDLIKENGCPSYYGLYNPLCPSPNAEDRNKMMMMKFNRFIYLDNNATHPIIPEVKEEMNKMIDMIGNASSPHDAGVKVRSFIENARVNIAKSIGLETEEEASRLIFTGSGTESINTYIKGVFFKNYPNHRKLFVTTKYEHKATLNTMKWLCEKFGAEIYFLGMTDDGRYTMDMQFLRNNAHRILLVSMMAANNELGVITEHQGFCDFIKGLDAEIKFHVDMSQTLGKMKRVSVIPNGIEDYLRKDDRGYIDAATFTAHKFGGPTGVSVLYVKNFNDFEPLLHGGNQEFQKRASTYNPIQIVGMAKAIEMIKDSDIDKMESIRDYMENRLISKFKCRINCKTNSVKRLSNNSSVTFFYKFNGEELIEHLSTKGIFISAASACNSREKSPSYVLKAIGMSDDEAYKTVRISLNKFTTKEDIDILINELESYIKD